MQFSMVESADPFLDIFLKAIEKYMTLYTTNKID